MADLSQISSDEMLEELNQRGVMPRCQCGKWNTRIFSWDSDGYTLRCSGCLKAIGKCRC